MNIMHILLQFQQNIWRKTST